MLYRPSTTTSFPFSAGNARQDALEVGHVVVTKTASLTQGQAGAIHQAGMILLVQQDHIAAHDQRADHAQVGLHAGGKNKGGFLADPFGQLMLQLLVQFQGAVEEARAGAGGAEFLDRIDGGLPHARVGGQPQIIIGTAHDQALPLKDRFRAFALGHRDEIRIEAALHGLLGFGVTIAFLKNIHVTLSFAFIFFSTCLGKHSIHDGIDRVAHQEH